MSSGVFAYGAPPRPLAPPRDTRPVITTPEGTFKLPDGTAIFAPPLAPCPKCKRHIKDSECPFCYADSLVAKPTEIKAADSHDCRQHRLDGACALCGVLTQRDDALRDCADLVAAQEATMKERDGLLRENEKLRIEHKHMLDNLTATQARCTELIQETRKLRRQKFRLSVKEAKAVLRVQEDLQASNYGFTGGVELGRAWQTLFEEATRVVNEPPEDSE